MNTSHNNTYSRSEINCIYFLFYLKFLQRIMDPTEQARVGAHKILSNRYKRMIQV